MRVTVPLVAVVVLLPLLLAAPPAAAVGCGFVGERIQGECGASGCLPERTSGSGFEGGEALSLVWQSGCSTAEFLDVETPAGAAWFLRVQPFAGGEGFGQPGPWSYRVDVTVDGVAAGSATVGTSGCCPSAVIVRVESPVAVAAGVHDVRAAFSLVSEPRFAFVEGWDLDWVALVADPGDCGAADAGSTAAHARRLDAPSACPQASLTPLDRDAFDLLTRAGERYYVNLTNADAGSLRACVVRANMLDASACGTALPGETLRFRGISPIPGRWTMQVDRLDAGGTVAAYSFTVDAIVAPTVRGEGAVTLGGTDGALTARLDKEGVDASRFAFPGHATGRVPVVFNWAWDAKPSSATLAFLDADGKELGRCTSTFAPPALCFAPPGAARATATFGAGGFAVRWATAAYADDPV